MHNNYSTVFNFFSNMDLYVLYFVKLSGGGRFFAVYFSFLLSFSVLVITKGEPYFCNQLLFNLNIIIMKGL